MRLQKLHAYNADVKTEKHNFFKGGYVKLSALYFKKLERFSHSIEFQKLIMVQSYNSDYIMHWNCFLSSNAMDGKVRQGLKLENLGQSFQV